MLYYLSVVFVFVSLPVVTHWLMSCCVVGYSCNTGPALWGEFSLALCCAVGKDSQTCCSATTTEAPQLPVRSLSACSFSFTKSFKFLTWTLWATRFITTFASSVITGPPCPQSYGAKKCWQQVVAIFFTASPLRRLARWFVFGRAFTLPLPRIKL